MRSGRGLDSWARRSGQQGERRITAFERYGAASNISSCTQPPGSAGCLQPFRDPERDLLRTVIIIPARFASTRFPGKPLAPLKGPDGVKTLIHRCWETALEVEGIDAVFVATDDARIADAVKDFGGQVLMTPEACENGTERCAEALCQLDGEPEIIVNLQGDAPLTPPWFIEDLVAAMRVRPDAELSTPVLRCDRATYNALLEDRQAGRVGATTVVFGPSKEALYFSKEVLPFLPAGTPDPLPVFHHVGVYAYRPTVLRQYAAWPVGPLERLEGLEQLRFLENRRRVLCVEVEARGRVFWELNNPEDIARIEAVLAAN